MPLPQQLESQDKIFARAFGILEEAIAAKSFPGAATAITLHGHLVALRGFGRFTYDDTSPLITAETVFDLASITKVMATTAMAMLLMERGQLDLEMPLVAIVPEFISANTPDPRRKAITLHHLLTHSSGLAAHERFYLTCSSPEAMWQAIFCSPLQATPGSRAEYSDIGFLLLGLALERIAGEALDAFCAREVYAPLGMAHTEFRRTAPSASFSNPTVLIAPTGYAPRRENTSGDEFLLQGVVNDGNARTLGGVAGHAGMFAPAEDVARFAECMLRGGSPLFCPETVARFTARENSQHNTSRALGWDTPSSPSSSGQYFSPRSFGHLGYTGTSLWIDPERQLSVTLLTNRTMPLQASVPRKKSDFDAIKRVRPLFHDAVVEALE